MGLLCQTLPVQVCRVPRWLWESLQQCTSVELVPVKSDLGSEAGTLVIAWNVSLVEILWQCPCALDVAPNEHCTNLPLTLNSWPAVLWKVSRVNPAGISYSIPHAKYSRACEIMRQVCCSSLQSMPLIQTAQQLLSQKHILSQVCYQQANWLKDHARRCSISSRWLTVWCKKSPQLQALTYFLQDKLYKSWQNFHQYPKSWTLLEGWN